MKAKELRNLSKAELILKEKTLKQELFKLNQQRYAGRVEKPHMFKAIRKDIAKTLGILSEISKTAPKESQVKIKNG